MALAIAMAIMAMAIAMAMALAMALAHGQGQGHGQGHGQGRRRTGAQTEGRSRRDPDLLGSGSSCEFLREFSKRSSRTRVSFAKEIPHSSQSQKPRKQHNVNAFYHM